MPETTPLIKAALNLRGGAGFDVYLLSSPQTLENTGFIAGELSLIVSLVLYRPVSVYEL